MIQDEKYRIWLDLFSYNYKPLACYGWLETFTYPRHHSKSIR
mgnify:CR=1 FL=1